MDITEYATQYLTHSFNPTISPSTQLTIHDDVSETSTQLKDELSEERKFLKVYTEFTVYVEL